MVPARAARGLIPSYPIFLRRVLGFHSSLVISLRACGALSPHKARTTRARALPKGTQRVAAGMSTVWDDQFPSNDTANEEFLRIVADEGMSAFLESAKVVPFRR